MIITRGLKGEELNIYALTHGYNFNGVKRNQIILFKKRNMLQDIPYLLNPQPTNDFTPSVYGSKILNGYNNYIPEYIALIDTKIEFNLKNNQENLFKALYDSGHFLMWSISSPLKYFINTDIGYSIFFRVYCFLPLIISGNWPVRLAV